MELRQLLKQAREMQDRMERELVDVVVEASVGGGMVSVKMNGKKELVSVQIDPEVLDPEDATMLQDLVLAAVNEAGRKIDEALRHKVGSMAASMPSVFK